MIGLIAVVFTFNIAMGDESKQRGPTCPQLSVDQRHQQLIHSSKSQTAVETGITRLLSEAFTPYLKQIHAHIITVTPEQIQKYAREVQIASDFEIVPTQFGKAYCQTLQCDPFRFTELKLLAPHSEFNGTAMANLLTAVRVVNQLVEEGVFSHSIENLAIFNGSTYLISNNTYAMKNLEEHLFFAYLSVLQSAAQLTSDPVLEYSDKQLLRISMQQTGTKPSLMVLHSLMLPPAFLGEKGSHLYFPNAVMSDGEGGLVFTPAYREFIKERRNEFVERTHRYFEFGHGCPVGHCLPGEGRPGLQYFLDAILYVYDRIGE